MIIGGTRARTQQLRTCGSPAGEHVVSHPDPSLLITPLFFLHNQDGGDGGNAQTRDRYPDSTSHLLNTVYV